MLCLLEKFAYSDTCSFIILNQGKNEIVSPSPAMCSCLTSHTPDRQSHNTNQMRSDLGLSSSHKRSCDDNLINNICSLTSDTNYMYIWFFVICFDYFKLHTIPVLRGMESKKCINDYLSLRLDAISFCIYVFLSILHPIKRWPIKFCYDWVEVSAHN